MDDPSHHNHATVTYTHCVICEHFCGLAVTTSGEQILAIEPDKANPYSWRDFSVKGTLADQVRSHPQRLRGVPLLNGTPVVRLERAE